MAFLGKITCTGDRANTVDTAGQPTADIVGNSQPGFLTGKMAISLSSSIEPIFRTEQEVQLDDPAASRFASPGPI